MLIFVDKEQPIGTKTGMHVVNKRAPRVKVSPKELAFPKGRLTK